MYNKIANKINKLNGTQKKRTALELSGAACRAERGRLISLFGTFTRTTRSPFSPDKYENTVLPVLLCAARVLGQHHHRARVVLSHASAQECALQTN